MCRMKINEVEKLTGLTKKQYGSMKAADFWTSLALQTLYTVLVLTNLANKIKQGLSMTAPEVLFRKFSRNIGVRQVTAEHLVAAFNALCDSTAAFDLNIIGMRSDKQNSHIRKPPLIIYFIVP